MSASLVSLNKVFRRDYTNRRAWARRSLIYLTVALGDLPDWAAMLLGALAGLGGGAFVGSVGALIVASTHSPLSALGEGQVASWKGFASYLKDVARGKATAQRPDLFERYLPLAAGFGLGQAWAKHYQKLGNVQVPGWFHALQDGDFDGVVAMMAATNVSTNSDGGAAAGASGASGGGGSGAG